MTTIGFLSLISLSACTDPKTPTETAQGFWSAIAENDTSEAVDYCSVKHKDVSLFNDPQFQKATFTYGKITIDGNFATVDAQFTPTQNKTLSFTTYLVKEDDIWRVDCQRSVPNLAGNQIMNDFFNNLNDLGKSINKQINEQIPMIEKEIESFGSELKQQLDDLGSELQKAIPQEQQNGKGSITTHQQSQSI